MNFGLLGMEALEHTELEILEEMYILSRSWNPLMSFSFHARVWLSSDCDVCVHHRQCLNCRQSQVDTDILIMQFLLYWTVQSLYRSRLFS